MGLLPGMELAASMNAPPTAHTALGLLSGMELPASMNAPSLPSNGFSIDIINRKNHHCTNYPDFQ